MTATAMKYENVKKLTAYTVLLRNRQTHGEFTVIPFSENKISPSYVAGRHGRFVAIMTWGRHCRTPDSSINVLFLVLCIIIVYYRNT